MRDRLIWWALALGVALFAYGSLLSAGESGHSTPIYFHQGGATLTVESGGTLNAESGSTATLAGTNTLSGATTISGALTVSGATTFSANQTIGAGKTLSIASGGTLDVASGGTAQVPTGGTLNVSGTQTIQSGGVETIASGGTLTGATGSTVNVSGTGAIWGTTSVKQGGALVFDAGSKHVLAVATKGTTYTALASESGTTFIASAEDITITLPTAAAGLWYRVHVGDIAGATGLAVDVTGSAKVHGNGLTATGGKGLLCTHATARDGDFVELVSDGTDWWISSISGTWAQEP